MRRNDVASTSFRRRVPTRFLINQCQNNYISHLKIWYYRKFKDSIERNSFAGIGWLIIGGAKGYVGPPLSNYWGGLAPPAPPPPPPSSYAYVFTSTRKMLVYSNNLWMCNTQKYVHSWCFTKKPYSKPLERNEVYNLITASDHATSMTWK